MWPGPTGRVGVAEVHHGVLRPVAAADGPGLRRHLLQPPLRRDDTARGDDGRPRRSCGRARPSTSASPPTRASAPQAVEILRAMGTPLLIHQPSYSMLNRWVEEDLLDVLGAEAWGASRSHRSRRDAHEQVPQGHPRGFPCGTGQVARPLAAHRYVAQARAGARPDGEGSGSVARADGAGLAAAGRAGHVGAHRASSVAQLDDNLDAVKKLRFTDEELRKIDRHAVDAGINLWKSFERQVS